VTNVISELMSNVYKNSTIPCQHSKLWVNGTLFNDPKSSIVVVCLRLVSQYVYTQLISKISHCLSHEIILEFVRVSWEKLHKILCYTDYLSLPNEARFF
jgi:hypothetical protein